MDRMSGDYPPPPPGRPPAFPPPPEAGPPGPPGFPPPPGGPPSFPPPSQPGPPGYPPYGYPPGPPGYGYPPGPPGYGYPPGPPPGWGAQPPRFYPLDLGRNFQLSWSLFRYAWRTLFGIGAVILIPLYAVLAAASAVYSPVINEWAVLADVTVSAGQLPPPLPPGFFEAVGVLAVLTFGLLLIGLLASGAAVVAIDDTFRGAPTSVGSALSRAASRYVSLLGAQLLYFLIAIGVILAGFVLGAVLFAGGGAAVFLGLVVIVGTFAALMFVAVRLAFIVQSITLERASAVDGFGRSWRLVANSGWRVFGYLLLIGLISGILGAIVQALTTLLLRLDADVPSAIIVGTLIQGVASVLLLPIVPLVLTLLYYDLRWRRGEPAPLPGEATRAASPSAPAPGP